MATAAMETNHCSHTIASNNLDHIYFFTKQTPNLKEHPFQERPLPISGSPEVKQRSRNPSRDSSDSHATANGSASSSTSSSLNPQAATFSPSPKKNIPTIPPPPHTTPSGLYELRQVEGRGLGLVATTLIPRGARIICEKPLLKVSGGMPFLACLQYQKLSPESKTAYDELHSYVQDLPDLENLSRMYLIDYASMGDDGDQIDRQVGDHVRIMGAFLVNRFNVGDGFAVYATASRLNHACVPNALHGFNPNTRRFHVHAVRDIAPGEEITINYIGSPATYMVRSQRIAYLRANYGFTCTCEACLDTTTMSDQRRDLLNNICWGMEQYDHGAAPMYPYIADGPAQAFKLAVNAVNFMNAEGLHTTDYLSALHAASKYALKLRDWQSAMQYAVYQQEEQLALMGREVQDKVDDGTAASCWIAEVKKAMRGNNSGKEADKLLSQFEKLLAGPKKIKKKAKANKNKNKAALWGKAAPSPEKTSSTAKEAATSPKQPKRMVSPDRTDVKPKETPPNTWAKVAARAGNERAQTTAAGVEKQKPAQ